MQPYFVLTPSNQNVAIVMENLNELTLADMCCACSAQTHIIVEMVSEILLEITSIEQNLPPEHWRFASLHLHRAKVAMRLNRDSGVNFAGTALAVEFLDERQELKLKPRRFAI